jgi:hypothetical protein
MISDYKILGIEETKNIDVIKSAYRKRVKEVHPDNTKDDDKLKNHLLFIQINNAYKRIIKTVDERLICNNKTDLYKRHGKDIVLHKDPAFAYYKMGMSLFMKIHPNRWNKERTVLPIKTTEKDEQEKIEQQNIVKELMGLFPKAYYYFSIVIHEYPESIWAADAEEKISKIEERTKQYIRIIESFDGYDIIDKERTKRLNEIVKRTKEIARKERGGMKW